MVFRERTYSVLLVTASERFVSSMMPLLPPTDHWPVDTARSEAEARRRLAERDYDIVVINAPLPDDLGMRLAMDICADTGAGVLLLVKSELFSEIYTKVVGCGVVTLPKPTNQQMVAQSLGLLCATRERLRRMEQKQATVEEKIQEIRLVDRAKWLLIQHRGMTEPEAHRYIEKQAMDRRLSRRAVAEEIIGAHQEP